MIQIFLQIAKVNRMPIGLVNAPSNFQRAINNILGNARFKEAFA